MSTGVVGTTAIARSLTKPHKKKCGDNRSGERGGQATGPPRPIHFSSKISFITCARARLPLIEAIRYAESLRKLAQSTDLQQNMDQ